jgi:hypothetical protein
MGEKLNRIGRELEGAKTEPGSLGYQLKCACSAVLMLFFLVDLLIHAVS